MNSGIKTPILFLIFNRADTTQIVFNELRKHQPKYLYVAADGPRSHKEGEAESCRITREIINQVDWDCEVKTLFRDHNLGCGKAVSEAITWFFDNVEEGIILEDDCLPNSSFFKYTEDLLAKHRNDHSIFAISGDNFIRQPIANDESYYYSIYNHVWGWASWKRAWAHYDLKMKSWPEVKASGAIKNFLKNDDQAIFWENLFDGCHEGRIDTWDYQWTYTCWCNQALTALPAKNLIKNIGFDERATHTKCESGLSLETQELLFPLKHPKEVIRNFQFDEMTWKKNFRPKTLVERVINRATKVVSRFL